MTDDETERQRAVIRRLRPSLRLDNKSADWIQGVYETLLLATSRDDAAGSTGSARGTLSREVLRFDAADPVIDPKTVASADIISKARTILGAAYDPTGKSEAEIMRAAVSRYLGAAATSAKSDEYLRAALDVAVDMIGGRMDQQARTPMDASLADAMAQRNDSNPRFGRYTEKQLGYLAASRDSYIYELTGEGERHRARADAAAGEEKNPDGSAMTPYQKYCHGLAQP